MEAELINLYVGQSLPDSEQFTKFDISRNKSLLEADDTDYSEVEMLALDYLSDYADWNRAFKKFSLSSCISHISQKCIKLKVLRLILCQDQREYPWNRWQWDEWTHLIDSFCSLKKIESFEKIQIFLIVKNQSCKFRIFTEMYLCEVKNIKIQRYRLNLRGKIVFQSEAAAPDDYIPQEIMGELQKQSAVQTLYHLKPEIAKWLHKVQSWDTLNLQIRLFASMEPQDQQFQRLIVKIPKIEFNFLQKIEISGCNLTTIEPITRMKAPSLLYVNLSQNSIVSLKPLIKLELDKVRDVTLDQNQILETPFISQCNWPQCYRFTNIQIKNSLDEKKNNIQSKRCFLKGNFALGFMAFNRFKDQIAQTDIVSEFYEKFMIKMNESEDEDD